ncbi:MAG: N-acetylmuramoyl-L-alanine amidase [Nitrospira sp.]|nr:N-acetylmuramoyl-L-alanine amidase [Nitrospira sp.]
MAIQWIGSPNKDKGREGFRPEAIVIHIMEGTLKGTDAWFRNEESGVSAHYGIGKTGEIHQYVGESDTAWHAGRMVAPTWQLLKPDINPNWYTIGIEHEGRADTPWPDAMYETSARLIDEICRRGQSPVIGIISSAIGRFVPTKPAPASRSISTSSSRWSKRSNKIRPRSISSRNPAL